MTHEWKIRSMDEADSTEAVKAAQRHNVTTAVWLGQAIRAHVATERGNGVPAHDITGPHQRLDPDRLIALAALELPQWLRRRVHRLLGETLGVEPPKLPKKLSEWRTETAKIGVDRPTCTSNINELAEPA
jgi:hypothetical protein